MQAVQNMRRGLFLVLATVALVAFHQPSGTEASHLGRFRRSVMEHEYEMHPIDICIFMCDLCYTGPGLLRCANDCIRTEAAMGPFWLRTCKLFTSGISVDDLLTMYDLKEANLHNNKLQ